MTGYPGDEHVFSVVGLVLARSPDCNLRILVTSCVPAAPAVCVSLTRVYLTFFDQWTL